MELFSAAIFVDDIWKQGLFIPGFASDTLEIFKKSFPSCFVFLFLAVCFFLNQLRERQTDAVNIHLHTFSYLLLQHFFTAEQAGNLTSLKRRPGRFKTSKVISLFS